MSTDTIRKDFPDEGRVYLNNASAAPNPLAAIRAVSDFFISYNTMGPDSTDSNSLVKRELEGTRRVISKIIGCRPEEIVLTQSTTDGVNLVARGLTFPPNSQLVIRGMDHEHHANYYPWLRLSPTIRISNLRIDGDGFFEIPQLVDLLGEKTGLIALSHALYNTGAIIPVEEIGRLAREKKIPFFLDSAQTVGCLPLDVNRIQCDFMAFNGSKWLCGPMGTGIFYCSRDSVETLEPLGVGGESAILYDGTKLAHAQMPARFQAGFRNYAGMVGLRHSASYMLRYGISNIRRRAIKLADYLRAELLRIPGVEVFGPENAERRTSIIPFNVEGRDPKYVVERLEREGIMLAVREFSKQRFVRASPHFFNTESEIQRTADAIKKL